MQDSRAHRLCCCGTGMDSQLHCCHLQEAMQMTMMSMPRPFSYCTPPTGHLAVLLRQSSRRVEIMCFCFCWVQAIPVSLWLVCSPDRLPDHVNKESQRFAGTKPKILLGDFLQSIKSSSKRGRKSWCNVLIGTKAGVFSAVKYERVPGLNYTCDFFPVCKQQALL